MDWAWSDNRQGLRGPHYFSPVPLVQLEIIRGGAQHRLRTVKPPVFLIGSAADCDLVLGDRHFPEVHTYLYVTSAGITVRHIGQDPQLTLNGLEVETARVVDGDQLRMGPFEFIVRVSRKPAGDDDTDSRPHVRSSADSSGDWDIGWEQAQLLLCDVPAPLKPLSQPQIDTPLRRALAMYPELRRAIA